MASKEFVKFIQIQRDFYLVCAFHFNLNPQIIHGNRAKKDEFEFIKDTGMYVYKAGHMAIR